MKTAKTRALQGKRTDLQRETKSVTARGRSWAMEKRTLSCLINDWVLLCRKKRPRTAQSSGVPGAKMNAVPCEGGSSGPGKSKMTTEDRDFLTSAFHRIDVA